MQENFVKIRQSMIYDTRSKFFHESKDQVVMDWQDSSLSHADVVAIACFLKRMQSHTECGIRMEQT